MDSWSVLVAVLAFVALILQGAYCLLTNKHPLSLGILDVLLAGIVGFVTLSLCSGQMVLASELGAIMIQGEWPSRCLRVALIVAAILPPLCLFCLRSPSRWRSYLALWFVAGLAVGVWAATRVSVLNLTDPDSHQVYLYDVWWPPLIVWFALSFAVGLLALTESAPTAAPIAFGAALITPLASFALRFEDLSDSHSRPGWLALERIGFIVAILILAYSLAEKATRGARRRFRIAALCALGAVIAAGLWYALGWMPARARAILGLVPLLLLGVGIARAIIAKITSKPGTAQPETPKPETAQPDAAQRPQQSPDAAGGAGLRSLQDVIPVGRLSGIVHALALPVIALGLADLFSIGYVNRGLELLIVLFLWLFFAEGLAEGALDDLPRLFKYGVFRRPAVKYALQAAAKSLPAGRQFASSIGGFFTEGKGWQKAFKATLAPLAFLCLLIAVNEAINYDKTVIQAFRWAEGGADAKRQAPKEDVSRTFAEGVINALGRIRQDLRTDLILAQRTSSGEHPSDVRQFNAGADANTVDDAVAKSDELQFGGVSVPIGFFVSPLQHFVRSWLAIRSVSGRLQSSAPGAYMVWVNSSYGESWRRMSGASAPDSGSGKSDPGSTLPSTGGRETDALPPDKECAPEAEDSLEAVDELSEKVAFDVARTDRSFIAAGMTNSWAAFQYLRRGLRHWSRYEQWQNSQELEHAVACFRAAVREDRRFVLANYRFGVALREDGRPLTAIQAFRESRVVNPDFIPAALKEAETLYELNRYYPDQPAAVPSLPANEKRLEAKRLWIELTGSPERQLSLAERRAAYYGLCGFELDERGEDGLGFLPYYYCSRARALSYRLSAAERRRPEEKVLDAQILNTIGVALEIHRRQQRRDLLGGKRDGLWVCSANAIPEGEPREDGSVSKLEVWGTARSRAALDYYRMSLKLAPDDDVVRCNAAIVQAFLHDNMEPMRRLMREAGLRIALGDDLQRHAHDAAEASASAYDDDSTAAKQQATGYYRRALDEYAAAVDIDRTAANALIGYAFAVWQWKVDFLGDRTSAPPETVLALRGERYARAALRLARFRHETGLELLAREALGEILLAQARTEEAVEELSNAEGATCTLDRRWSGLNETRWDLALAQLCASKDRQGSDARAQFDAAMDRLSNIRKDEEDRERRPFSDDLSTLDTVELQARCPSSINPTARRELPYTMREPSYTSGQGCRWSGVVVTVNGPEESLAGLYLHVWGGGVDERIGVGGKPRLSVQLAVRQKSTVAYYFAQLESKDGEPVSIARPFATHGTEEADACAQNLVQLNFDQSSAATPDRAK